MTALLKCETTSQSELYALGQLCNSHLRKDCSFLPSKAGLVPLCWKIDLLADSSPALHLPLLLPVQTTAVSALLLTGPFWSAVRGWGWCAEFDLRSLTNLQNNSQSLEGMRWNKVFLGDPARQNDENLTLRSSLFIHILLLQKTEL